MTAMPRPRLPYLTPEDYLAWERKAEHRHEYCNGRVIEMQGASEAHVTIVANMSGNLFNALKKSPCRALTNDLRVKVGTGRSYRYPDLLIVCGERIYHDELKDTLINPTLLCEVLSNSTEESDLSVKLQEYQAIDSVREVLFVHQDRAMILQFRKHTDEEWLSKFVSGLDQTLKFASVNVELPLAAIYDDVTFPAASAE